MPATKSGLIPENFIDTIIERADIYNYIAQTVNLKTINNNSFKGLCPFHNEKTPSFHVHRDKQYFHCFGCGEHGNVINYIMKAKHLTFPDTIKILAEDLNLELPEANTETTHNYKLAYRMLQIIQTSYVNNLQNNKKATQYLHDRGLSKATIEKFGIGFASNSTIDLEDKKLAQEIGILNARAKPYFYNRITFPILNTVGKVIGFGARVLDASLPKYLNSKESFVFHKSNTIYGLFQAKQSKHDYLIVVEGYMDVIALTESGVNNAVATLGTAITPSHITLLFKHYNKIAFCFDGDTAGEKAAWKTVNILLPHLGDGKEIKFVLLPKGEDPDSFIKQYGKDKWRDLFKNSLELSEFFFKYLQDNYPHTSIAQKANFGKIAQELISKMPNSIGKQLMFQKLEVILETQIQVDNTKTQKQQPKIAVTHIEKAIKMIVHNPSLAHSVELGEITQDASDAECLALNAIIELCITNNIETLAKLQIAGKNHKFGPLIDQYAQIPFDNIDESILNNSLQIEICSIELGLISSKISSITEISGNREQIKKLFERKSAMIKWLTKLREISNVR